MKVSVTTRETRCIRRCTRIINRVKEIDPGSSFLPSFSTLMIWRFLTQENQPPCQTNFLFHFILFMRKEKQLWTRSFPSNTTGYFLRYLWDGRFIIRKTGIHVRVDRMVGIKSYLCAWSSVFGFSPRDEMWYLMNTRNCKIDWHERMFLKHLLVSFLLFLDSWCCEEWLLVTDMMLQRCHLFLTEASIQMLVSIQSKEWINLCVNKGILQLDVMKLYEMRQKETVAIIMVPLPWFHSLCFAREASCCCMTANNCHSFLSLQHLLNIVSSFLSMVSALESLTRKMFPSWGKQILSSSSLSGSIQETWSQSSLVFKN